MPNNQSYRPRDELAPPRIPPWAELLTRLLDNAFVIPGTQIRVGLDAILGLIAPGAGDTVGAIATLALFYLAFKQRVPKVVLLRMLVNTVVDAVVGAIPLFGDVFDVFHRASAKNLELLRRHAGSGPARPSIGDYAVVGAAIVVVLLLLTLPFLVALAALHWLARVAGA